MLKLNLWLKAEVYVVKLLSQNLTNEKWTLDQVMAWCRQTTSHNLSQYWLRLWLIGHNELMQNEK